MSGCTKCRKRLMVTGIILALLIAVVICVVYFIGFDNIKAVYYGLMYDKTEIEAMKNGNSERLNQKVSEYEYITAREPTAEEMDAVESGEITEEQLSELIAAGLTLEEYRNNGYKKTADNPEEKQEETESQETNPKSDEDSQVKVTNQDTVTTPNVQKQPESEPQSPIVDNDAALQAECDEKVSQIVAKMYILRSSFTSSLAGLAGQAYADYEAGVPKSTIVSNYIGQGYGLEAQCDASVNALMSELTGILTQYGRSTELVNTIYSTYEGEKQYTKAYYMSLYMNN